MTEFLDAIDEEDRVVGTFEREFALANGFALRVAGVVLHSSRGTVFLQRRSKKKKYPLHYDYSAAGHVQSGENFDTAAVRELDEELGVRADLQMIGEVRIMNEGGRLKKLHRVYWGAHDGPFKIYAEEVEDVHEFSRAALVRLLSDPSSLVTPSFRAICRTLILPILITP